MSLDSMLDALIKEGAKHIKKRGRPKGSGKKVPDLSTVGVMSTQPKRQIAPGNFKDAAIVASYKKKVCTGCGHYKIDEIPRIFLLRQHLRQESTKLFIRLTSVQRVREHLHTLPLRTELYLEHVPGCKLCLKEMNENAKSSKRQREDRSETTSGSIDRVSLVSPGTILTIPRPSGIQARGTEQVHHIANQG